MNDALKNRPGFTLVEVLIALTLTAVLGAAVMGAFVSQSRFFDHQDKVGAARAVSRGAMNIMMSEMRMIEQTQGVVDATSAYITLRVPYVFGMSCGTLANVLTITTLPADLSGAEDPSGLPISEFSGFAYRSTTGAYTYIESAVAAASLGACAGLVPANGGVVPGGGQIVQVPVPVTFPVTNVPLGAPVFLYHIVTYAFDASTSVPGRLALWREVAGAPPEEILAPFANTAEFRYFESDAATAGAVPGTLSNITGVEIVLDAVSERPNSDGTFQSVPLTTAVHFKNR